MQVKLSGFPANTSCVAGATSERIFLSPQAPWVHPVHPWVLLMASDTVQLES